MNQDSKGNVPEISSDNQQSPQDLPQANADGVRFLKKFIITKVIIIFLVGLTVYLMMK